MDTDSQKHTESLPVPSNSDCPHRGRSRRNRSSLDRARPEARRGGRRQYPPLLHSSSRSIEGSSEISALSVFCLVGLSIRPLSCRWRNSGCGKFR